ncbi:MAG: hypothetical protein Q4C12_02640 [Clostridia bacterium]|nr:hypothetical protein [Clostridia bacterium]
MKAVFSTLLALFIAVTSQTYAPYGAYAFSQEAQTVRCSAAGNVSDTLSGVSGNCEFAALPPASGIITQTMLDKMAGNASAPASFCDNAAVPAKRCKGRFETLPVCGCALKSCMVRLE